MYPVRLPHTFALTALVCLALAAVVTAAPTMAAEADPEGGSSRHTGRLTGTVLVGPELSSKKMRFRIYQDSRPGSPLRQGSSQTHPVKDVVVYLESAPATPEALARRPEHLAMSQEGETFTPHVLPVVKGSTVEFPNSDPIFHNVFSLSRAQSFDLGRFPRGSSRSVRFDDPGVVKVFCHIHSDMAAVVLVLDNPFFAVPDEQGRFEIEGIPPGDYKVIAWHDRIKPHERKVRIRRGETFNVNFTIPLEDISDGDDAPKQEHHEHK